MKIAILGWGSLIWDPQDLPREGIWERPGPSLCLEFSRVSRDCRLTLVINPDHGEDCKTYYVLSPRVDIDDAIEDLRSREGTPNKSNIGFVDLERDREQGRDQGSVDIIRGWAEKRGFSGIVWTDLEANFEKQTGKQFGVDAAVAYLEGLPKTAHKLAMKYIDNAPAEVSTPLRSKLAGG